MARTDKRKEFYKLYKEFDNQLPKQCQNCGSCEGLDIHHIVPLITGGNNVISNLVRLCASCHGQVHGVKITRKELLIAGKERAKRIDPEWRDGRPKRRLTPQYLHAIELLQTLSYNQVSKKTGISKSTLQRIKRQHETEGERKA